MEEQLEALALGVGARVAEELVVAPGPLKWSQLSRALGDDLASRGTLTKTLRRLLEAGLVLKAGDEYELAHAERTAAVLLAAADLHADVSASRTQTAANRAARLRGVAEQAPPTPP